MNPVLADLNTSQEIEELLNRATEGVCRWTIRTEGVIQGDLEKELEDFKELVTDDELRSSLESFQETVTEISEELVRDKIERDFSDVFPVGLIKTSEMNPEQSRIYNDMKNLVIERLGGITLSAYLVKDEVPSVYINARFGKETTKLASLNPAHEGISHKDLFSLLIKSIS